MQATMKLGTPGALRDRLVAAVLAGRKTATTSLRAQYEDEGLPLPVVGERRRLLDSDERPVATVEVTEVHVMPIGAATAEMIEAEGAGFASAADYRSRHERVWATAVLPNLKRVPVPVLDENTEVVVYRFRVVEAS